MNFYIQKLDERSWIEEAQKFNDYSYTHFWKYSEKSAERIKAFSENISIVDSDGNILALANIRIRLIPFGLGGVAYVSDGPMVDKGQKYIDSTLKIVLSVLKEEYVEKRGLVLRISQRHKIDTLCDEETQVYKNNAFYKFEFTNSTMLIDLEQELDGIRKGLHQKWRNILNKSEKQDIKIIAGYDDQLFSDFSSLFKNLINKKNFKVDMDDNFFASIQKVSDIKEKFQLVIAYKDETPISGHLSSICGDTSVYILGATNSIGRNLGAAYLLQWYVINESKKQGCRWYDLGGVDKELNPDVYRFKQRMGGVETKRGNVFQFKYGIRGAIILFFEKLYKHIRN